MQDLDYTEGRHFIQPLSQIATCATPVHFRLADTRLRCFFQLFWSNTAHPDKTFSSEEFDKSEFS